jgi:hypothetical protein
MRYLGLLVAVLMLLAGPAEAKKKKRHHKAKRAKIVRLELQRRHVVLPRPPQETAPRPEPAAPLPVLSAVQADDDEVPGSRNR